MEVFTASLNQMGFLFILMAIGYLLARLRALPQNSSAVMAELENNLFIPALDRGTFMGQFTPQKLSSSGSLLLVSAASLVILIPLAILYARWLTSDRYIRKIFTYGLCFSNFGFMGNAVVKALFPGIFLEYLLYTLPLWMAIYLWAVPALLMPESGKPGLKGRLKTLLNPMLISLCIGAAIGLSGLKLPGFIKNVVTVCGDCMSPVAMILTGVTIARLDLKKIFRDGRIYVMSLIRLAGIPFLFLLLNEAIRLDRTAFICTLCAVSMPVGLNPIVIPEAYGLDSSVPAGPVLISQILSCITIPLLFMFFVPA